MFDKNEILLNAQKWIKFLLINNYNLNESESDEAIEKSNVIEMSARDSIEDWAEVIYKFWKKLQ